jgi:hypothetical protein
VLGDGLFFFFTISLEVVVFDLVSRLKEKVEPSLREKEMVCPMLASAWQNSRHWDIRIGSPPLMAAGGIFTD